MITETQFKAFRGYLQTEEWEQSTVEKCLQDVRGFMLWLAGETVSKERVTDWKEHLKAESLQPETTCATRIWVSEVKYITIEAIQTGRAEVSLKGKIRTILIPGKRD